MSESAPAAPPPVQVEDEDEQESKYDEDTAMAPTGRSEVEHEHEHAPPPESTEASPPPPSSSSSSAPPPSTSASSPPSPVHLHVRVDQIRSSYTAKRNHFVSCDPLVVVAVDNRPLFKTSIRSNSTSCSWDLSTPGDVCAVQGGLALGAGASIPPTLSIPVSSLTTARLQVCQEDFSRSKEEDDLGSFSIGVEEIVTRAWRREKNASVVPSSSANATASSSTGTDPGMAASAPPSPASAACATSDDEWYPVSVDGVALLERATGRHLGEASLRLSVQLGPYLRHLASAKNSATGNLRLLAQLVSLWLDAPGAPDTRTPLRHLLLDEGTLLSFIQLVVRAGADPGSMDGQRLRERLVPLLHRCIDVFGAEVMLPLLFSRRSAAWSALWDLRRCVPPSQLSSTLGWTLYTGMIESFVVLAERAALLLEPVPPPPVKSPEEIETERLAAELAEKRAAKKRRPAAAAAAAAGEEEPPPSASSKKKKKSLASLAPLPEPPVLPPSSLSFGLSALPVLRELFESIHVRLGGYRRATAGTAAAAGVAADLDWSSASESKLAELASACDLLWRAQHFLFRYADTPESRADAESVRAPLFAREGGDPHALWLQKAMAGVVKKTRDTLADNRDLHARLQQHADYFAKLYPTEAKPKKSNK